MSPAGEGERPGRHHILLSGRSRHQAPHEHHRLFLRRSLRRPCMERQAAVFRRRHRASGALFGAVGISGGPGRPAAAGRHGGGTRYRRPGIQAEQFPGALAFSGAVRALDPPRSAGPGTYNGPRAGFSVCPGGAAVILASADRRSVSADVCGGRHRAPAPPDKRKRIRTPRFG